MTVGIKRYNNLTVLITIDEIQNSQKLKDFASMYQVWLREEYDIAVLMTGLPQQISEVQNNEVLTFLLRSKRIMLQSIDLMDVYATYKKSFSSVGKTFEKEALELATKTTQGYAYMFQLLGYYLWKSNTSEVIKKQDIENILSSVQEDLFRNVLSKIVNELSTMDVKFLEAMAKNERPVKLQTIGETLDKPKNYLTNYRARLIDNGIITPVRYGYLDFTVPYLAEYLIARKELY